ncbi:hypothetical protein EUX98_g8706 [Antrodiella citrinella]|uniref:CBS domain-containing protein n=1 Tax=Antrodiella citrinella TaxID=2447956 RepID=A0A4S4M4A1_9APHY|nr:hypothetical protein EUX98_g8706 [Antrodiella citrinella]
MSAGVGTASCAADTRRRQANEDEVIRKKIESDLLRKRHTSASHHPCPKHDSKPNGMQSPASSQKPRPALIVPEYITVTEASQRFAAHNTECALVVDDEDGLSGMFTAKDLAYRVVAEGLEPRDTPVSQIMTRNPVVAKETTSAMEILRLMVKNQYRHLPVCDRNQDIVGLLDIAQVFYAALSELEDAEAHRGSSLQPDCEKDSSTSTPAQTLVSDLITPLNARATVGPKTPVSEVAKLMKACQTTSVCVVVSHARDPRERTRAIEDRGVVRVMTPHPDTAPPTKVVQDALEMMHHGEYTNLPVVEENGRVVGVVDMLKLAEAVLEQTSHMRAIDEDDSSLSRTYEARGREYADAMVQCVLGTEDHLAEEGKDLIIAQLMSRLEKQAMQSARDKVRMLTRMARQGMEIADTKEKVARLEKELGDSTKQRERLLETVRTVHRATRKHGNAMLFAA